MSFYSRRSARQYARLQRRLVRPPPLPPMFNPFVVPPHVIHGPPDVVVHHLPPVTVHTVVEPWVTVHDEVVSPVSESFLSHTVVHQTTVGPTYCPFA